MRACLIGRSCVNPRAGQYRCNPLSKPRDALEYTPCARSRSSMPSSTSCVAEAPGAYCRTTFRPGRAYIITSELAMGQCGAASVGKGGAPIERRHDLPTLRTPYPTYELGASAERHIFCEGHAKGRDTPKD